MTSLDRDIFSCYRWGIVFSHKRKSIKMENYTRVFFSSFFFKRRRRVEQKGWGLIEEEWKQNAKRFIFFLQNCGNSKNLQRGWGKNAFKFWFSTVVLKKNALNLISVNSSKISHGLQTKKIHHSFYGLLSCV